MFTEILSTGCTLKGKSSLHMQAGLSSFRMCSWTYYGCESRPSARHNPKHFSTFQQVQNSQDFRAWIKKPMLYNCVSSALKTMHVRWHYCHFYGTVTTSKYSVCCKLCHRNGFDSIVVRTFSDFNTYITYPTNSNNAYKEVWKGKKSIVVSQNQRFVFSWNSVHRI